MKTVFKSTFDSPIGILTIASTNKGICMIEFDNEKRINKHLKSIENEGFEIVEQTNEHIKTTVEQLHQYFESNRTTFDIPIDTIGTDFQKKVWNALLEIPYGVTRSYKEQSKVVGDLKAIRAVATANGSNKISIVIPCHRVVGSDGSLTGYGGELWRKQFLLNLESSQQELF